MKDKLNEIKKRFFTRKITLGDFLDELDKLYQELEEPIKQAEKENERLVDEFQKIADALWRIALHSPFRIALIYTDEARKDK